MKKYIITALCGLLLLVAGFQAGHIVAKKQCAKELEEIINLYASEEPESAAPGFDWLILDNENSQLLDAEGRVAEIGDLGAPKNIIARFSATGCRPCIDNLTENLQAFAAENPDWHINLLIDNIPLRDLYVLSKEFGPSFSLFSTERVKADMGSAVSPVVFRLTPGGMIYRHFTCNPEHPEFTAEYIKSVKYQ